MITPAGTAPACPGVQVWQDQREIADFTSITRSITDGLARSKVLLSYYSATYPSRLACQWELTAALIATQHRAEDPLQRILVVNPEPGSGHIHPVELQDAKLRAAPAATTPTRSLR